MMSSTDGYYVQYFEASRCPVSKLRIYNSPTNLLFVSRFLACSTASTLNCYFQDDDWHVTPIRTLYSQFKRDPGGALTVHTGSEGAVQYGLQWCFFRESSPSPLVTSVLTHSRRKPWSAYMLRLARNGRLRLSIPRRLLPQLHL